MGAEAVVVGLGFQASAAEAATALALWGPVDSGAGEGKVLAFVVGGARVTATRVAQMEAAAGVVAPRVVGDLVG